MERIIFFLLFAVGLFIAIARIVRLNRKRDKELLGNFLESFSNSFHESHWNLIKNFDPSIYVSKPAFHYLLEDIQKDTGKIFESVIIDMCNFPKGGFKYYTADSVTNNYVDKCYKLIKKHFGQTRLCSAKERKEKIKHITEVFYHELGTILSDGFSKGELKIN